MNKYLSVLAIIVLFSIVGFITGCNVIEEPYGPGGEGCIGQELFNDTVYNDTTVNKRRILLEEFTGHMCPNCPEGALVAAQLEEDNPDQFLSVSVHTGSFALPDTSNPDHPYPEDFRTPTGDRLLTTYQIGVFPLGMLNRTNINGSLKVDLDKWTQEVNAFLANPAYMAPRFKLNLVNIYNSKLGERSIRIRYKATALQNITGNIAIVAYVTESHIIAPQTDNSKTPSYIPDYEHNHVLRVGFPNVGAGKTLFVNPTPGAVAEVVSENDEICTSLSDDWVPENMEVTVFLVNSDTDEILHVERVDLTN